MLHEGPIGKTFSMYFSEIYLEAFIFEGQKRYYELGLSS